MHIRPAHQQRKRLFPDLHNLARLLLRENVVCQRCHINRQDRKPPQIFLRLPQRILGQSKGGLLVEGRVRLEDFRNHIPARARLLLLQHLNLLRRQSLTRWIVNRLAIRPHEDLAIHADFKLHAISAVDDEGLALGFGSRGDAVADDLRVQLGGWHDSETRTAPVGEAVGNLKGEMVGTTEDVVGLERAEFPD